MSTGDNIQRVRMYMSENDRSEQENRPLHIVIMEILQREGATGASAIHGVAGFGPGSNLRVGGLSEMSAKAPIIIEWIDHAERIHQILPLLDEFLPEALVTIEDIRVHRAVMRSKGAFAADQKVGDIMQASPHVVTSFSRLGEAISLMLGGKQSLLPVLNEQRKIVGMITEVSIANRANLHVPLYLLRLLNKEEGRELVGPITGMLVSEVMQKEWRTVQSNAFIQQALTIMLEWGYDQLPVLDRDDNLAGLVSWSDVLSAVMQQQEQDEEQSAIREAEQPTPVSLIMQQNVPSIPNTQNLAFALQQLLKAPDRYLVVVDTEQHVQGIISDIGVFRNLSSEERAPLIAAIQNRAPVDAASLPGANRNLEVVMEREPATISPKESIRNAIRRLIELRLERLPVVDGEGKLLGLIARGGLLRALVQESM